MSPASVHTHDYAIVDLGSNSFHLHVIRMVDGQSRYLDRYREVVRIAEGIQADSTLSKSKEAEALGVLARYGDRIQGFEAANVRAIGTSAFRQIRRARGFLFRAEEALGFPIEIISGEEEARLIYLGILAEESSRVEQRFVIDIGGGSTEFIVGDEAEVITLASVEVGNISLTRSVFGDGDPTPDLFDATVDDLAETMRGTTVFNHRDKVDVVMGASGTFKLAASLLRELGYTDGDITPDGLGKLSKGWLKGKAKRKAILAAGLPPEREATFVGALALMQAIFKAFEFDRIQITQAGVRQGLLHDMFALPQGADRKRHTLNTMMKRYHIDRDQARRLHEFCRKHIADLAHDLGMSPAAADAILGWAAALHETGLPLNYSGYHKHSAYIVKNGDFPGFTRLEQGRTAFLVLNHRKRIKLDRLHPDDTVPMPLLFLFRLAWLFHRRRRDIHDPVRSLAVDGKTFTVELAPGWLHIHPLAAQQLERERDRWAEVGIVLELMDGEA